MAVSDVAKLMERFFPGNSQIEVPVNQQRVLLGLGEEYIGKNGLIIGCHEGNLVRAMNKMGSSFEGIDERGPNEEGFMKQKIYGSGKDGGGIPRNESTYDVVAAFQYDPFNEAFTYGGGTRHQQELHNDLLLRAQLGIYEGLRVLKPGERFVVYPRLANLEEAMGPMLRQQGFSFVDEPVSQEQIQQHLQGENGGEIHVIPGIYNRTVLTKAE